MATQASTNETITDTKAIEAWFEQHPNIKLVNVQYVTVCGVVSGRVLSTQAFLNTISSRGGMHQAVLDLLFTVTGSINPAVFARFCHERGLIKPDLSSVRLYPDSAGLGNTAVVVAESTLFGMDPRANLRKLVEDAKLLHKIDFLAGFEIEVAYLQPDDDEKFSSAGTGLGGLHLAASSFRSTLWPVVNETTVALAEGGVLAESSHKEYGISQWEYVLPPYSPVEAVDAYVFSVETIKNIAHKHGLVATVFPVPYPNDGNEKPEADGSSKQERFSRQKNGQHIHISATLDGDDGHSESSSWNPDELLSGILVHIPALTAIGLSQVDSYQRVGESSLCTGGYVGWGEHHRDMPVRRMHRNHWEIRVNDGTSNPYAMVGAIIGAALDRKPLTISAAPSKFVFQSCPSLTQLENSKSYFFAMLTITPALTAFLSEEQRTGLGITKALPKTLQEALQELEADRAWAESILGKEYVHWYLTLKKAEEEALSKMDVRERRTLLLNHF